MSKENLEIQFEELIKEYIDRRIEQRKKYLELKQIIQRIYFLKEKFRNNDSEEFQLEKGRVKLRKYSSRFSSVLAKEFGKLTNNQKRELFKTGLLRIKFNLNNTKYEKLVNQNEKNPIDKYVLERKNIKEFYLSALNSEEINKELSEFTRQLDKHRSDWDEEISLEEESLNELEDYKEELTHELMNEINPADPYYLTDDDHADMSEVEREEKGYDDYYGLLDYDEEEDD